VAKLQRQRLLEDPDVDAVREVGPEEFPEEAEEASEAASRASSARTRRPTRSRAPASPVRAASTTPSTMSFPTQATGAGSSAANPERAAMATVPRGSASQTSRKVPGIWPNTPAAAATRLRMPPVSGSVDLDGRAGGKGLAR
jgi:hypothetical protein